MSLFLLVALQIQLGSIQGKVMDPSGGAIRAARAVIVDGDRERGVESDETGSFYFHNLPYGRYLLRIDAAGFRTHEEVVEVRSNLTREAFVSLALSGTAESLTVRAEDRPEASVSVRVEEEDVARVPGATVGRLFSKGTNATEYPTRAARFHEPWNARNIPPRYFSGNRSPV